MATCELLPRRPDGRMGRWVGSLKTGTGSFGAAMRYGLAGMVNTLACLVVIGALEFAAGIAAGTANALGFAFGLATAFMLNRNFVFRGTPRPGTVRRFLVAFSVSFAVNQIVLLALAPPGSAGPFWRWSVQVAAISSYTLVMFLFCQFWVYRAADTGPDQIDHRSP
jgi:putative flippase GtrA